jgi:hypothetical protein
MKNARMILSAFVVFTIVGSALAFSPSRQQGSVYCSKNPGTGACENRIDYRVSQSTTNITDPCGNGSGKEFVLSPTCTEITATTQFEQVLP